MRIICSKHYLILVPLAAASLLRHISQPHSSKLMTVIQPPGVQWVAWNMRVTFSIPEFNLKKQMNSSWSFCVDDRSESSITYVMIIVQRRDLLGELGIIMNLNDHTVIWDTNTIPIKYRDISTLSSVEGLIEVYMNANEPQTLRDEYS
jgi:hypothetical protein